MKLRKAGIFLSGLSLLMVSCRQKNDGNQQMVQLLEQQNQFETNPTNPYASAAILKQEDSIINSAAKGADLFQIYINKANTLLQLGREQRAVVILDSLSRTFIPEYLQRQAVLKNLALAYLRLGERTNCINNHS